MSLKNIISKILEDANLKALEMKNEAATSASLIIKEAETKAQVLSCEIIKQAQQIVADETKRFEVSQAIEYKNAILTKKQELIDAVFKRAKEEIVNLNAEQYLSLIKTMLLVSVEKGDETIVISNKERNYFNDTFLKSLNNEFKKAGKEGKLTLKIKDGLKEGSFILETRDTMLDISIDLVLSDLREELSGEVAHILFGEK
ncbi:MAG: V-type ATP synthase subunit E family protein [Candidatus Omnitrophica bacterium]|nr:V-type ATP synthase subunit E family protein [Candidatus Omnitrophota bacterium]